MRWLSFASALALLVVSVLFAASVYRDVCEMQAWEDWDNDD